MLEVLVSQPLFGLLSQLPNPALQLGTQAPEVQAVPPLALVQLTPQVPQFEVVVVLVSQPLLALASQLPQPALQPGVQSPLVQAMVPWALVQAAPQPPQLPVLV